MVASQAPYLYLIKKYIKLPGQFSSVFVVIRTPREFLFERNGLYYARPSFVSCAHAFQYVPMKTYKLSFNRIDKKSKNHIHRCEIGPDGNTQIESNLVGRVTVFIFSGSSHNQPRHRCTHM